MWKASLGIAGLAAALMLCACSNAPIVVHEGAPPTQVEVLAMLSSHQFAELDRRFTDIHHSYKTGLITDEDLRADFRVFYPTDAALEPMYALWVQQMPKSYVAHLARGIYYKKLGLDRRGTRYISETSEAQIKGMEDAFALASQELRTSMSLDDKPLLSYLHAMDITSAAGQDAETRQLLDLAVRIDPHNFVVREKYMGTLETRWGGSVEQMTLFLNECRKAQLSARQMQSLEALVQEDAGWNKQYVEGDPAAAVSYYLQAAQLKPAGSCKPCGPISQAADALLHAGRYQEAIPLYSKVLSADPNFIVALNNRGFSELQVGDASAAVEDFTHAADLGDAYAMDQLGKMYLVGTSVALDRQKAIEWLKKAAALGYEPSKAILPLALNPNMKAVPEPGGPRL